tara:strand:- start:307 stop:519 length:213 start_codon:yes stop_codon:yes gene_type:complete
MFKSKWGSVRQASVINIYFIIALSNDICPSEDSMRIAPKVKATVINKNSNAYLAKGIFLSNNLESPSASR